MMPGELTEQMIYDQGIDIDYFPLNKITAVTVRDDQEQHHICINSNKKISSIDKRCILEHEYSHIEQGAFYNLDNSKLAIKKKETKANDATIRRLGLAPKVLKLLKQQWAYYEIAEQLEINEQLLLATIDYIKRKGMDK